MRSLPLCLAGLLISVQPSFAEPNVTVSIKPIHSITSALMKGVGTPDLLIDTSASPHDFALKPSHAQQLQSADIVIWVGHSLEGFLEKAVETIAKDAVSLELLEAEGITALPYREGGHDDHGHDDHKDHEDHDDHKDDDDHKDHEDHDDHKDHEEHEGHDDHKDEGAHEEAHEENGSDPHIWLDPKNAKAIASAIRDVLIDQDPANQALYKSNHDNVHKDLDALESELAALMKPLEQKPFVVFHDAYQYFEQRFGLNHMGSITLNPEVAPSVSHIKELKAEIAESQAVCVFSEPQFPQKFVQLLQEGTNLNTAILDPLGTDIDQGPDHYPQTMRTMANAFSVCLN